MNMLNDEISRAKTELNDPIVIIAGDFNKKPFQDAIVDFPDISVLDSDPTRGDEKLDLVMTNVVSTADIKPPLESDDGQLSNWTMLRQFIIANSHKNSPIHWKKLQARALKIIYGFQPSYKELLALSRFESLWENSYPKW